MKGFNLQFQVVQNDRHCKITRYCALLCTNIQRRIARKMNHVFLKPLFNIYSDNKDYWLTMQISIKLRANLYGTHSWWQNYLIVSTPLMATLTLHTPDGHPDIARYADRHRTLISVPSMCMYHMTETVAAVPHDMLQQNIMIICRKDKVTLHCQNMLFIRIICHMFTQKKK